MSTFTIIEVAVTRRIWCRHDDCDRIELEEAGKRPAICPGCGRVAAWSLEPKTEGTVIRGAARVPKVPYVLSFNDKQFLRQLRIKI